MLSVRWVLMGKIRGKHYKKKKLIWLILSPIWALTRLLVDKGFVLQDLIHVLEPEIGLLSRFAIDKVTLFNFLLVLSFTLDTLAYLSSSMQSLI